MVEDAGKLEQALTLLGDHGFKAYPLSAIFNQPAYSDYPSPVNLATDLPSVSPDDRAILETLLNQKTLLEDELRKYRTLLENSGDIIYALDFGGSISFVTSNVCEILGYQPDELIGRNVLSLLPPDQHVVAVRAFGEQMSQPWSNTFLTDLLKKDGGWLSVEISARAYYENDVPMLQIGLVRDITVRKQMEAEVLQRNRELRELYDNLNNTVLELRLANQQLDDATRHKSEFLANMSHELRTPLNAIIGFSEVLYDQTFGPLSDKQRRFVDNILNSGKHLLALVNDVLDLSKVEAGKMKLMLEELRPLDIINETLFNLTSLAQKKQIVFDNQAGATLPLLLADRGKLKQILYNIYSNAIKFTPDGGSVETTTRVIEQEGDEYLEIAIRDTGIGIQPSDQERIFEEFQMVDSTLSKKQQGTGLGLALCRKLTQMHGGTVTVTSELGVGSTFIVMLPLKPVVIKSPVIAPAVRQLEGWQTQLQTALNGGKGDLVLIVEDDDKSAELLELYVNQGGYRVERSRSGEEALQKARSLHPALITLDIILPHKNGWDVLRELKAAPETADIPVLVVSMMDNREIGFQLGAVASFVKPVQRDEFLHKVTELKTK